MRPTQCVGGLYLTVADSLAPLLINNNNKKFQLRKTKKVFASFPQGFWHFPTRFQRYQKQCCPRAEDKAIFEDLRLRGQGLDLRGQGQGLQNVSLRTSSRTPLLSFCTNLPQPSQYWQIPSIPFSEIGPPRKNVISRLLLPTH